MKKAKVVKANATPGSEMSLKREKDEDKLLRNERALHAAAAPSSAARVAGALQVRVGRRPSSLRLNGAGSVAYNLNLIVV